MNTRKIGDCKLEISEVGLGCMSLPVQKNKGKAIIHAALDGGINFLDTADLYQNGENEKIVGESIKDRRDQVIVATKVGNQLHPDGKSWSWNPKKEYLLEAVENSLKRLQVDYIDLCQLHGGTIEDPWEETLEAFELLKSQGKIREFGISSIRPNVIRKVMGMNPPATVMMQYSPLDRRPEETVFPALEGSDTRVLVRGAFAKGLLVDKQAMEYMNYSASQIQKFQKVIGDTQMMPESVLIKFGLSQAAVASLVIGASSITQVNKIRRGWEQSQEIEIDLIKSLRRILPVNHYHSHR